MDQNISRYVQQIVERKGVVLVLVIVVMCMTGAAVLFREFSSQMTNYQEQIKQKNEKNNKIAEHEKSFTQLNELKSLLVKTTSQEELINQLEDYASKDNVSILNENTADTKDQNYYTATGMHLSIKVENFQNLVSFLHRVETSPYAFKVEYWSATVEDANKGSIHCEINITSIQIKP